MARWRLLEPHYLITDPPTKWEYIETDRDTGRQTRKQYDIPRYLHHESVADFNDREEGGVVVSDGVGAKRHDIIFRGEPTPGMLPLDDDAFQKTEKFKEKWSIPNREFDPNNPGGYASMLSDHFVQQQDRVNMQMTQLEEKRVAGMDQFMATMTAMMQQNQKILEMLTIQQLEARGVVKPIVDDLPPLEEPTNVDERPVEQDTSRPAAAVAGARRRR